MGIAISSDGTPIHYTIYGGVPAIGSVVLAACPDTQMASALSSSIPVVAIDVRGSGQSGGPTSSYSYSAEQYGQDIIAVLDALAIPKGSIVGYSHAWPGAAWAAINRPDRVSSVTFIEPASGVPATELDIRASMVDSGDVLGAVHRVINQMSPGLAPPQANALASQIIGNYPNPAGMSGEWRARQQYPATPSLLSQITVPTQVAGGSASTNSMENNRFANGVPGAVSTTIPGASHLAPAENPGGTSAAITPFILAHV